MVVRTMQDAVDLFRMMKERWGLTNDFCDDVGGLTNGHTDKVLGPTEDRRLGYDTFALFMELMGLELHAHVSLDAVKRMEAIWEKRERPLYPNAKVRRISKKLVERAKPHVFREMQKASTASKMSCFTAEHRSRIARKAAKSRWRKVRAMGRNLPATPVFD